MQHNLSQWWKHVSILNGSAFIWLVQTSWGWQSQTVWDSLWCCKMMERQIAWRKGVTGIFTSSPPQIFPSGISQHNDVSDVIKLGERIWMGQFSPLLNFVIWPQIVISKCLQFIPGRGSVRFARAGVGLFSHDDFFVCLFANKLLERSWAHYEIYRSVALHKHSAFTAVQYLWVMLLI